MFLLKRKYIFAAIAITLLSWIVYAEFFATQEALKVSDNYHVDKLLHFLGGVFVAGVLLYGFKVPRIYSLALLLSVSIGWEVFEILFFPNVRHFYETLYAYWLSDTQGDIILDMLGGISYILYEKRLFISEQSGQEAFSSE